MASIEDKPRDALDDDVSASSGTRLDALQQCASSSLSVEQRWTATVGGLPPSALTGMLLDVAVLYEEQCKASGGLTLQQQRELSRVAKSGAVKRGTERALRHGPASSARSCGSSDPLPFAVGTEFHREWKGRLHVVIMTADGLLWSGQSFGSLSAVARAITGTRWNGYRFFGVNRQGVSL